VDNLKVHHSRAVKGWLAEEENKKHIEVFHLPSYSPEFNPDERLDSDLKGQIRSDPMAYTRDQIKYKIRSNMKIIRSNYYLPSNRWR